MTRAAIARLLATGLILGTGLACAQNYPSKPIRILTTAPGGGADLVARLIAQALTASLGQPVIVENRGGANGVIAIETVAKAQADGYTMLVYSSGMWILPLLQPVPYHPVKDFMPVTMADRAPNVLVVHPSVTMQTVKELIALAKAKPGTLNYASGASGTSNHLAAELFKSMAGVNIVRIPYKGAGPAVAGLIAGQVQLMFATAGSATPHVRSGRLRAMATTGSAPSALAPDLPTVAASGLPGYEAETTHGLFMPAKTPIPIINRLNRETVRLLNTADMKEKFIHGGVEVVGDTPEQFAAKINAEIASMTKLIKDTGIRAE